MSIFETVTLPKNTRDGTMHKSSVSNNNIMEGMNVIPMKGQTTTSGNGFSIMRKIFMKTNSAQPANDTTKRGKNSLYQDHSQYLLQKKAYALGKKIHTKEEKSFNSNNKYDVTNAKRRMRSSGSGIPKKAQK
jgi:hypothetical protein